MSGSVSNLPFFTRLWFAWLCLLRVLFDGAFAGRVWAVRDHLPELPSSPDSDPDPDPDPVSDPDPDPDSDPDPDPDPDSDPDPDPDPDPDHDPALALLALFQRDGRFVDFLEQDISSFDDAEVGAAARIVHGGCRKALHAHAEITTVRAEDEETTVEVTEGIDTGEVKLTGNVGGDPPYRGVLRHRGWRARGLSLPTAVAGHDATVVAPAEVEL